MFSHRQIAKRNRIANRFDGWDAVYHCARALPLRDKERGSVEISVLPHLPSLSLRQQRTVRREKRKWQHVAKTRLSPSGLIECARGSRGRPSETRRLSDSEGHCCGGTRLNWQLCWTSVPRARTQPNPAGPRSLPKAPYRHRSEDVSKQTHSPAHARTPHRLSCPQANGRSHRRGRSHPF